MADWEEVRQLAEDFKRVQESFSIHKLSERNCIELVSRLIDAGQVQVVYTLDGKEYVTPQQIEREVRGELAAHRGRVNVTELQRIMNVDLSHVENKINEMLKHDRSLLLLQGELISKTYIDALCEEINDTLQESGQRSVADISKSFSLPNNFLLQVLEDALNDTIKGELDKSSSGIIYTEAYVNRYRSRVRGLFSAITSPTFIGPLLAQGSFQEKLFLSVLHKLIASRELCGCLRGHGDKALYVPDVYVRMQNKWSDSFLSSNGYLEYDALRRLGIEDPKSYVKRRYCSTSEKGVMQLASCVIGETVLNELEGVVDNLHDSELEWVDVMPLLPSPCTLDDAQLILHNKYSMDAKLKLFGNYVTTAKFVQSCCDFFQPLIKNKAAEAALEQSEMMNKESSPSLVDTKTSRAKRSTKEKKSKGKQSDVQLSEEPGFPSFMTTDQIAMKLSGVVKDEKLSDYIGNHIMSTLQLLFVKEVTSNNSVGSVQASAGQMRKRHANLQERIQGLWNTTNLFNKAISLFKGEAVNQLSKYLLKTLCSDLINIIVGYLAEDLGLSAKVVPEEITPKDRNDITSKFPEHIKKVVSSVNTALSGKDVTLFLTSYQHLCEAKCCGFFLKHLDKKKERQLIYSHQQSLIKNLSEEQDSAMALHIVSLLLFHRETNCIIHIPGKFVPTVIAFLLDYLPKKEYEKLVECQHLITAKWKASNRKDTEGGSSKSDVGIAAAEVSTDDAIQTLIQDLKLFVIGNV